MQLRYRIKTGSTHSFILNKFLDVQVFGAGYQTYPSTLIITLSLVCTLTSSFFNAMVQIVCLVGITALACTQVVGVLSAPVLKVYDGKPAVHLVRRGKDNPPVTLPLLSGGQRFLRHIPGPQGQPVAVLPQIWPRPLCQPATGFTVGGPRDVHLFQVRSPGNQVNLVPFPSPRDPRNRPPGMDARTPGGAAQRPSVPLHLRRERIQAQGSVPHRDAIVAARISAQLNRAHIAPKKRPRLDLNRRPAHSDTRSTESTASCASTAARMQHHDNVIVISDDDSDSSNSGACAHSSSRTP